jgi:antitoxin CcdA
VKTRYPNFAKISIDVSAASGRPTNVTQPDRETSEVAERSAEKLVAEKNAERWLNENAQAISCYNAYLEKCGLPLEEFRMF